jgi:GntR family transcriptional repressor for pyruvate dehydrogenase complex
LNDQNDPSFDNLFAFDLKRAKLHEQISDRIQALIVSESLRPGDKLPGERELADKLGVSRTVIHEAMQRLCARGLIVIKPGCGSYVATLENKRKQAGI